MDTNNEKIRMSENIKSNKASIDNFICYLREKSETPDITQNFTKGELYIFEKLQSLLKDELSVRFGDINCLRFELYDINSLYKLLRVMESNIYNTGQLQKIFNDIMPSSKQVTFI